VIARYDARFKLVNELDQRAWNSEWSQTKIVTVEIRSNWLYREGADANKESPASTVTPWRTGTCHSLRALRVSLSSGWPPLGRRPADSELARAQPVPGTGLGGKPEVRGYCRPERVTIWNLADLRYRRSDLRYPYIVTNFDIEGLKMDFDTGYKITRRHCSYQESTFWETSIWRFKPSISRQYDIEITSNRRRRYWDSKLRYWRVPISRIYRYRRMHLRYLYISEPVGRYL
jgi:hypothetical protein